MMRIFWLCLIVVMITPADATEPDSCPDQHFCNLRRWCNFEAINAGDRAVLHCDSGHVEDYATQPSEPNLVENVCVTISNNCALRIDDERAFQRYSVYSSTLGCSALGHPCKAAEGPVGKEACENVGPLSHLADGLERAHVELGVLGAFAQAVTALHQACNTDGDIATAVADARTALDNLRTEAYTRCQREHAGEDPGIVGACEAPIDRRWQWDGFDAVLNPANRNSVLRNYLPERIGRHLRTLQRWRDIMLGRSRDDPMINGRSAPPRSDITGLGPNDRTVPPAVPHAATTEPVRPEEKPVGRPPSNSIVTGTSPQANPTITGEAPKGVIIDTAPVGQTGDLSNLRGQIQRKLHEPSN